MTRYIQKHPFIMIVIGVIGISLSAIFVKYSTAPAAVTAAFRLLWTVVLMTPVVVGNPDLRRELRSMGVRSVLLSALSGAFLAAHFVLWFESLEYTSVASSTTIVCTEVIWVSLGFCVFLKGKLSFKAILTIAVAFVGSMLIALSDSSSGGNHLYGDILALLAAITVAVYMLLGRVVRNTVSTTAYTYVVYSSCAAILLLVCLFKQQPLFGYGYSAPIVGLLLGVFSTILGHSIFSWCLKYFSPSFVSASKLCEPVVASVFAVFLFQELPSLLQIIGSVTIIGSVYCFSRLEHKQ